MKLCTNCKWKRIGWFDQILGITFWARCGHPLNADPSTGKPSFYGSTERSESFDRVSKCGHSGRLFEPK